MTQLNPTGFAAQHPHVYKALGVVVPAAVLAAIAAVGSELAAKRVKPWVVVTAAAAGAVIGCITLWRGTNLLDKAKELGISILNRWRRPPEEPGPTAAQGLWDLGRRFDPKNDGLFTWWAPWRNMRQRNMGWRLDYILVSVALGELATGSQSFREFGTSDHAPVVAHFAGV